ncbi:MAG: hypothetical protein KDA75_16640 [Planctomycetaceae bacterium]|nr:hypothetical protein [Planctomycetaceae bacterium]
MDAVPARLFVTAGPDEGRAFGLTSDMVHIGTAPDNQIVLSDDSLAEHQASIASRNGRYAIYVPPGQVVEVEGTAVPTEKWVWLPAAATLRMGEATACRFESSVQGGINGTHSSVGATTTSLPTLKAPRRPNSDGEDATTPDEEQTPVGAEGSPRKGTARRKKSAARKAKVARFITDQPGETLVRLGEDGQLPELALSEVGVKEQSDKPQERNPLVLYGVLTCSFVLSLGMLLLEPPAPGSTSTAKRNSARESLKAYFGEDGSAFEPYQQELRQALVEAARGDAADERLHYRRVLQMLNAADIRDPANLNGLTGRDSGRGRTSDDELRELLQTLLSN